MEIGLLSILGIGFILGIKHAIEPDHIIAVSTIASHTKKLWRTSLVGIFWGIGHTATLLAVGLILILTKSTLPDKWAGLLEFIVGGMLVYLGVVNWISAGKNKVELVEHQHGGERHKHFLRKGDPAHHQTSYLKSMIIGLVHGLAGSAAMVLLTMTTVHTVWNGTLYILFFGLGTIAGMLIFTTILGIPFVLSANNRSLKMTLTRITGAVSMLFGLYYMYSLGVTDGLFRMWLG